MTLDRALQLLIGNKDDDKAEKFLRFLSSKLWGLYNTYVMDKVKMADGELKWNINVPNAKENIEYNQIIAMPQVNSDIFEGVELELVDVKGLDEDKHGLKLTIAPDGKSFAITGTPSLEAFRKDGAVAESTFELTLVYKFSGGIEMPEDRPTLEHKIPFVINQDPRKLWRDIPVDWEKMPEPKYKNEDTQVEYVKVEALADGTPQKDIVAASKRGRSHAQEGKPRDDHFRMEHMDNGWYIMAVADGAGSAKYSRQGSKIACDEAVNHCMSKFGQSKAFEDAIGQYGELNDIAEKDARKVVGNFIYDIVGTAAFKAHKAIEAEAALMKQPMKYYATTLLLTTCKKFSFGWFVASFWVGDGAICLYDRGAHTAKILGVPDEGEYAGQTRFLTMPEIFKDATALYQRLRFYIVPDFTALFLMSDGVSDPKFETDANLNNPDKWDVLWDDLKENGVDLTDDNEASKDQLLNWLDFWAPGNHDDRTIAILYEGEANETDSKVEEQGEEQQNE
ncbi:MAG: PP2C family serine/threonine-protein phosphatase [Bacteroidales bacterium]|nr:PP2C family serine/threonine-protein phosphatase [Bacteroidales bacterium]